MSKNSYNFFLIANHHNKMDQTSWICRNKQTSNNVDISRISRPTSANYAPMWPTWRRTYRNISVSTTRSKATRAPTSPALNVHLPRKPRQNCCVTRQTSTAMKFSCTRRTPRPMTFPGQINPCAGPRKGFTVSNVRLKPTSCPTWWSTRPTSTGPRCLPARNAILKLGNQRNTKPISSTDTPQEKIVPN